MPVDAQSMSSNTIIPPNMTWGSLVRAHSLYLAAEPRDAMYRISTELITDNWEDNLKISNALGVLLLTWNSAFYRYGVLDYNLIEESITQNKEILKKLRSRDIVSCEEGGRETIRFVYNSFLVSLGCKGKKGARNDGEISYSPVSVGKALHLMCPRFFPLWDNKIAKSYGCLWKSSKMSFDNYWEFIRISRKQADDLLKVMNSSRELEGLYVLKLIDEYNYLRFTIGIDIS